MPANLRDSAIPAVLQGIRDLNLGEFRPLNPHPGSAVMEQPNGPDGMGHDDARDVGEAAAPSPSDRALMPG